jgi:sulfite oxidase
MPASQAFLTVHPHTRRAWLQSAALAAAGLALPTTQRPVWGQKAGPQKQLLARSENPYNAEPALEELVRTYVTPWERFFVRNHGTAPQLDLNTYRLKVEGLVNTPREFALGELLQKFPAAFTQASLTCAGNRRADFAAAHNQKVPGVSWESAAIGHAAWSGVRLADVLKLVGVREGAKHVWFEGLDEVVDGDHTIPFGGSIPLDRVLGDVAPGYQPLLASHMNGAALTVEHGAPLRTLVPGYIGARSVKWLGKLVVSAEPSPNHYLAHAYKLLTTTKPEELDQAAPLYEQVQNAIIADHKVTGGTATLRGFALPSGAVGRTIQRVELTLDDGQTWQPAQIASPARPGSWVLWTAAVVLPNAESKIAVRSTDDQGQTQPKTMAWNLKGYQYNAWHSVTLKRS